MAERPTIHTERLTLRPFRMEDAPDVTRLCDEREIAANTLLIPHPYTPQDARTWLAAHQDMFDQGKSVQFAICLTCTGELTGAIGLMLQPDHERAEIGYWIGKPYWGAGYATEAAAAVLGHAFTTMRINRVYAYHYARNPASGRVMQKAGMRHEGCGRGHVKKWGVFEDCVQYGLLRADWEGRAANNRP